VSESMPYHVEKGPTWQIFDDYFSRTDRIRNKLYVLESLWTQPRFTAFADTFTLPSGTAPGLQDFAGLVAHANREWFGLKLVDSSSPDTSASWADQEPFDPPTKVRTGFWSTWYGDAEKTVRVALIRAIEVSLGLDHPRDKYDRSTEPPLAATPTDQDAISFLYADHLTPASMPYAPNLDDAEHMALSELTERFERNWPIEHWWICGARYFQASVTWRRGRHPAASVAATNLLAIDPDAISLERTGAEDAGRVVVVFVTPGSDGHTVYHDLEHPPMNVPTPPNAPPAPSLRSNGAPWDIDPVRCRSRFGSWIVGQQHRDTVQTCSYEASKSGNFPCPIKVSVQTGDVMTVQPVFEDGGVLTDAAY